MLHRLQTIELIFETNKAKLEELEIQRGHSVEYFSGQWRRKRQCLLDVMVNDNMNTLTAKVENLIELEERLRESQYVNCLIVSVIAKRSDLLPYLQQ